MRDSDGGITEVYVVTTGEYSDYGIASIWLTYDEANTVAADWGRVEVWPIGENKRTRGEFTHTADVDATTGEFYDERSYDGPNVAEQEHVSVVCWPETRNSLYANRIGIRVRAETQERADKVYSEVRARVLADISSGLPLEAIADKKNVGGSWVAT